MLGATKRNWRIPILISCLLLLFPLAFSSDSTRPLHLDWPRVFSGDEPHYLVLINSVLLDGDLDLANNYAAVHRGEPQAGARFSGFPLDHHTYLFEGGSRKKWDKIYETNWSFWDHGRVHDHYDSARPQGSPTGPFFRLVKATLALVGGDKQGDEAIFRSIQDYNRQEKIRDFLEKVNADIAEDRAATLRAFLSKGEGALRRALRDHRARAEKLVDQAMAKKDQMEKRLRPYQRPIARRGPN